MSLDQDIRDRFLTDAKTVMEAHLDDLEGMFQFHQDGTIELLGEYREMAPANRVLLHLIARRYQFEADLTESPAMPYDEIYPVFPDKDESTVRGYFMTLRDEGFARKDDEGHELVAERLPGAVERIESDVSGD